MADDSDWMTDTLFGVWNGLLGASRSTYAGLNAAASDTYRMGANAFDLINKATGGDINKVQALAAHARQLQQQTGQQAQTWGARGAPGLAGSMYQGLGGAIQAVPQTMATMAAGGVPALMATGALTRGDQGPYAAGAGAVEGLLTGRMAQLPLTRPAEAVTQAVQSGVMAAAQGENPIQAAVQGAAFGAMTPTPGNVGLRQVGGDVKAAVMASRNQLIRQPRQAVAPQDQVLDLSGMEAPPAVRQQAPLELTPAMEVHPATVDPNGQLRIRGAGTPATQPNPERPLPKYAASVNLQRINDSDEMRGVLVRVARANANFMGARGGVQDFDQTRQLAADLGMKEEDLLARRNGQAFNAAEVTAARDLFAKSRGDLRSAAMAASKDPSDANLSKFDANLARFVALQEQVAGIATEAGRALSAHRMITGAKSAAGRDAAIRDLIDQRGGSLALQDQAKKIADLMEMAPEKVARAARAELTPSLGDKIHFAWINSILSAPVTHARNTLGNAGMILGDALVERPLSAAIGAMRGDPNARSFAEAGAHIKGLIAGTIDAVQGLKLEMEGDRQAGIGNSAKDKLTGNMLGTDQTPRNALLRRVAPHGVNIPTDLLRIEDNFFKTVAYRASLHEQAVGMDPQMKQAFLADPEAVNPQAHLKAVDEAKYFTFQNKLGDFGNNLMRLRETDPTGLLRYIMPFIQTPTNIVKAVAARSPLGVVPAAKNWGGREGDLAAARAITGSIIAGIAGYAASQEEGAVTGVGPRDTAEYRLWRHSNQPNAIRIGDTQVGMSGLDPWALLTGTAADVGESARRGGDPMQVAGHVYDNFMKNFLDRGYVSGLSDFINALTGRGSFAQMGQNFAASWVPNVVAHGAQQIDPTLRAPSGLGETLAARMPGLSKSVPPRLDVWGQPIQREGALGPEGLSPLFLHRGQPDPVDSELMRLDVIPGMGMKDINKNKLSTEQHNEYANLARGTAKMMLDRTIAMPGYQKLPDFAKKDMIEDILRKTQRAARQQMLMKHPALGRKKLEKDPDG